MNLEILPLAITMLAGPQIMSALVLTTSKRAVASSLAFVAGVFVAASAGVWLYSLIGTWLDSMVNLGDHSGSSAVGKGIQLGLVVVLIVLALRSYRGRGESKAPKWMNSLLGATPLHAFLLASALIFLMPTDIVVMLTVGVNLASHDLGFSDALPFLLLTTGIAALPLLFYLIFYRRAKHLMPKLRDWMQTNSWAVNIAVYAIFMYLVLSD